MVISIGVVMVVVGFEGVALELGKGVVYYYYCAGTSLLAPDCVGSYSVAASSYSASSYRARRPRVPASACLRPRRGYAV